MSRASKARDPSLSAVRCLSSVINSSNNETPLIPCQWSIRWPRTEYYIMFDGISGIDNPWFFSPLLPPGFTATGPPFHSDWCNLSRFEVFRILFLIWVFELRYIRSCACPRPLVVTVSGLDRHAWL